MSIELFRIPLWTTRECIENFCTVKDKILIVDLEGLIKLGIIVGSISFFLYVIIKRKKSQQNNKRVER